MGKKLPRRRCLVCHKWFPSLGSHNRHCYACKNILNRKGNQYVSHGKRAKRIVGGV